MSTRGPVIPMAPQDPAQSNSDVKHAFDALLPAEMAQKAERIGAQKTRLDAMRLLVLAILAGAFIALGAMLATTVLAGAEGALPYGVSRLLAGSVFCLGLILVVVGGAELFTGNTLIVIAWAAGAVRLAEMLRAWAIVYAGNFIGAVGTAALVYLSGQYLADHGSVGVVALKIAVAKVTLPVDRAFFLGILCNVLVCLAVWLCYGARTVSDKVLAIIFPISAFVAAGFEHSVANMYFVPFGLLLKSFGPAEMVAQASGSIEALSWARFALSLVPVTLGNIVGGGVLVGAVYWFVYLRQTRPRS
jgi:formate/nitrite transporter